MNFSPTGTVRARLTFSYLGAIFATWLLTSAALQYFNQTEFDRLRSQMKSDRSVMAEAGPGLAGPGAAGRLPPPNPLDPERAAPQWNPTAGLPNGPGPGQPPDPNRPPGPGLGGQPLPGADHQRVMRARQVERLLGPLPPRVSPWREALPVELALAVLIGVLTGAWVSPHFTRPLVLLAEGATAFHERHFQHRIPLEGRDEFGAVGRAMNEMASQVAAQIESLEEEARRRQQLLADVAHELRSPVATLQMMAGALRDGIADQPERKDRALNALVDSAARMERMVGDLLDLARLDLREFPLHREIVDLRFLAEAAVTRHAGSAAAAGVSLDFGMAPESVMVSGDPQRLGQVLDNLVDNAISYSGAGASVTVDVWIESGAPRTLACAAIRDTGRGIPARHLPFIFDPFYRADSARTPGRHSGLGLRITRGLVEAHGGTLRLESEEGRGTRVDIRLPLPPPGEDSDGYGNEV